MKKQPYKRFRIVISSVIIILGVGITIAQAVFANAGRVISPVDNNDPRDVVVLLHGLGRSAPSMWLLDYRLSQAGYDVYRLSYDSISQSPSQIVDVVTQQLEVCCQHTQRTVHFVGHSLGGLVIRAYLANQKPQNLGRVVLLGTPNQGTPIVDYFKSWRGFDNLGPTTGELGTNHQSFPNKLGNPDYPVGVIAGYTGWHINDWYLPGDDDGLVPLSATQIPNMADYLVLKVGHGMLRYRADVAQQTLHFLQHGQFNHRIGENS